MNSIKMLYLCKSSATIVKDLIMNTETQSPKLKSATTVVLFLGATVLSILSQCSSIPLLVLASMFVSIAVIAFLCIAHSSFLPMLAIAPVAVISCFLYDSILSMLNILLIPITAAAVIYSYRYKLKRTWIDIAIASAFGVTKRRWRMPTCFCAMPKEFLSRSVLSERRALTSFLRE